MQDYDWIVIQFDGFSPAIDEPAPGKTSREKLWPPSIAAISGSNVPRS
jgi:hypothetical protein